MRITSVSGSGFGGLRRGTELDIPEQGVVLITGPNGSGKSSFLEGVSWALWGQSIRGEALARSGQECHVHVEFPGYFAERGRSKSDKLSLTWGEVHGPEITGGVGTRVFQQYESTKHAQAALLEVLPTYDQWRRTCVFTTTDGVGDFLAAPDSERRELFERLCGLEQFATGLTRLRTDLQARSRELQVARVEQQSRQDQIRVAEDALHRAIKFQRDVRSQVPSAPPVGAEGPEPISPVELQVMDHRVSMIEAKLREAQARSRRPYAPPLVCGACQRPYDNVEQAQQAHAAAVALADEATHEAAKYSDELATQRGNYLVHRQRYDQWQVQALENARLRSVAASHVGTLNAADAQVSEATNALMRCLSAPDHTDRIAALERDVAVLEGAERVLGPRGVRSLLVSNLISAVSASAQQWVDRFCPPGQRLEITATSTTKSGDASMRIGVNISGPISSYKSASQGERRRLDLSVLFALASFGTAEDSTIWLDEVLDGLDDRGVDQVCDVILELAEYRSIVVISHSERVISNLKGRAQHLHLGATPP